MIPKTLDQIEKADIDALVNAKESERRTREYKVSFSVNSDEEKREFLYDVSSLANAAGGDLIYGVRDQRGSDGKPTGIPDAAEGVATFASTEKAKLENLLLSSIAPRIPGLEFREIPGFSNGSVVIVRVPKSWSAPHLVTFKGATRFYSRNSTGKYPLDVFEIRSAFAASEALPERLKTFRQSRLASIVAGETPVPLPPGGKVILHLVPTSSLDSSTRVVISAALANELTMLLRPTEVGGWDHRFNFDGFLTFSGNLPKYVQLFRSSAIEAVDGTILDMGQKQRFGIAFPDFIPTFYFEDQMIKAVGRFANAQKRLGTTLPVFVMITLLGVKGYRLATGPQNFSESAIDRDALILPDVMIEDFTSAPEKILKPVFDAVAQSAGMAESPSYGADGNRKKKT